MKLITLALGLALASTVACSSDDDSSGSGGSSSGGTSSGGTSSGGTSSGGTGGTSSGGTSSGGASGSGTGGASTGGASGSGSGGTAGLPGTFGETACMKCVVTECASTLTACDADTDCKAEKDCVLACPPKNSHEADETCTDACNADSPLLDDFGDCFEQAVDAACEVPCD
jgi:hypothetical protein